MAKEYITGIWLAKFASAAELREYVSSDYEDEDNVTSRFETDAGLSYIDEDFMERVFCGSPSEIHSYIDNLNFVNNQEVSSRFASIELGDKNSVISIVGITGEGLGPGRGLVNEELFDYKPAKIENEYLMFVGLFRGTESDVK